MKTRSQKDQRDFGPSFKKAKRIVSDLEPSSVLTRSRSSEFTERSQYQQENRAAPLREFQFFIVNHQNPRVLSFFAVEELDVYWHLLHSDKNLVEIDRMYIFFLTTIDVETFRLPRERNRRDGKTLELPHSFSFLFHPRTTRTYR